MSDTNALTNTTYVVSGSAGVLGGLTANEIAAYGGLLIALATFLLNWYYKELERNDRKRKNESARRTAGLDASGSGDVQDE